MIDRHLRRELLLFQNGAEQLLLRRGRGLGRHGGLAGEGEEAPALLAETLEP